jgi:hypothetical protein
MTETERVAVLIDCDNMSHRWVGKILAEAAKDGTLGIKRGYGDWHDPHLEGWRGALPDYAIQPMQQFANTPGKNATDFALVIDAMDLLHAGTVETFCIVSSDSDFTRLAMRLRESGKRVHGIGARKTPEAFPKACDLFTYVEVLLDEAASSDEEQPTPPPVAAAQTTAAKAATKAAPAKKAASPEDTQAQRLTALLVPAVEANLKDDGWAPLSGVGSYLVNTNPTFDPRNYGYSKLSLLVRDLSRLEVKEVPTSGGPSSLYVRQKVRAARKRA